MSDDFEQDDNEVVQRIRAATFAALSPWADPDNDEWRDAAADQVADAILADLNLQVVGWFSTWPGSRLHKFNEAWELGPKAAEGLAILLPIEAPQGASDAD